MKLIEHEARRPRCFVRIAQTLWSETDMRSKEGTRG